LDLSNFSGLICDILQPVLDAILAVINPFLASFGLPALELSCEELLGGLGAE